MIRPEDCYVPAGADALTEAFTAAERIPNHSRTMQGARMLDKPFAEWAPRLFAQRSCKPLALYVHVPFCKHRCLFCPFYQNRSEEGFSAYYADLLLKQLELVEDALGKAADCRPVDAVFFGGGTPSDLSAPDLARVLRRLKALFAITEETEVTIEGRIRDFTPEKVAAWREAGANRFSLGLQSTDEKLRRRLGRLAGRDEIRQVLGNLADSGAVLIVDLIFGLPGQTRELLLEDLRFLAQETRIDGLDLYELIQFPNSPLAKAVADGRPGLGQPAERAERARMYGAASEALASYGFEHFTPQHWRRGERERSVYNRLAKSNADILPIGTSAGGNLSRVSIMMERDVEKYAAAIHAGNIPVRSLAPTAPMSDLERFKSRLSEAAERRELPPLSQWPQEAHVWAGPLLANWSECGLIKAPERTDVESPYAMTTAGAYWAKLIQHLIMGCLAPAESKPASGGHPHAQGHPGGHPHSQGGHPAGGHPGGMPAQHTGSSGGHDHSVHADAADVSKTCDHSVPSGDAVAHGAGHPDSDGHTCSCGAKGRQHPGVSTVVELEPGESLHSQANSRHPGQSVADAND